MTRRRLRSARWFETDDLRGFGHRSRARQMGYDEGDWAGKPVIAILNTWSDINPCHAHFRHRVEDVKRGIDMLVDDAEIARRRSEWTPPRPRFERGYGWMFAQHIRQANEGCDFDFLETAFGEPVGEPEIY